MRTIVKVDIRTYRIWYKVGVYIYDSESIAIRNRNISEYISENRKAMCTGRETQECYVGTWDRNRNKNKNRNWNWTKLEREISRAALVIPKFEHGVLYHHTTGWICHTPGQDPSHSDDDVTQYMQQELLRYMVYSSEEVLSSVCPFASVWTRFRPDWFRLSCPPWTKHALGYCPRISRPRPDLWDLLLRKERGRCSGRDGQ